MNCPICDDNLEVTNDYIDHMEVEHVEICKRCNYVYEWLYGHSRTYIGNWCFGESWNMEEMYICEHGMNFNPCKLIYKHTRFTYKVVVWWERLKQKIRRMKMKKIELLVITLFIVLSLGGCGAINQAYNSVASYQKEEFKCIDGNKIWVLEVGNDEGISVTSEIVGVCESD
jgi:hypothetical protein